MKDIIHYKGFIGSVHFNTEDLIFFGKIEGINDLVTFEGESVNELITSFHEAVNDYLDICRREKKQVHKSYKGSFNVRINPSLHRRAVEEALSRGINLNQLVQEAIEKEVCANN